MKQALLVSFFVVALGGVAQAEQERVTVTWSPVHLALPVVELEAEYNIAPRMGIGLILGAGRVSDESDTITATAFEAGAQYNYYFMKPFAGLHAGTEVLYLTLGDVEQDSSISGTGLSVAGYVGYKVLTSFGFTFVAQGGVAYLAVEAENSTSMASESKVYPLVNLNVGWSF